MLEEIERLTSLRVDFAWESTLSGVAYTKRIRTLKEAGY
jgi:predicted ABC-type ATPase